MHLTGLDVDLDDGDVGAERERRAGRLEERGMREALGQLRRRCFAATASSAHVLRDRRRAGDVERAVVLVEHDVGLVGLEQLGGELAWPSSTSSPAAWYTAAPPCCSEREPIVPDALRHEVGVAPDDVDLVHRDAGLLVGEHAPRRDVTLAVRRGAGVDDRRAPSSSTSILACSPNGATPPVIST